VWLLDAAAAGGSGRVPVKLLDPFLLLCPSCIEPLLLELAFLAFIKIVFMDGWPSAIVAHELSPHFLWHLRPMVTHHHYESGSEAVHVQNVRIQNDAVYSPQRN